MALRAHAVEDLQQHGTQQFLWRDAGASAFDIGFVHATEQGIHLEQGGIDHDSDGAQWMTLWHEIIQVAHGEKAFGEGVGSAHLVSL